MHNDYNTLVMEAMTVKDLPREVRGVHIHFVGIKGTGMVALVEILHARGAVITGSDVSERFYTDEVLEKLGLQAKPFSEKNITADIQYVIHSSAYSVEKNPDLQEASRRGLPILLYTEALGAVSRTAYSAGVCGVHGKTTTTGMVGTLLQATDLPSQVLAGSVIASFGSGGGCTMSNAAFKSEPAGAEHYFVAETCEYQRHFMSFSPQKIILTSVESDHQDYYPTYEDICAAFVDYICLLPHDGEVFYCADDRGACDAVSRALTRRDDIHAVPYGTSEACEAGVHIILGRVEGGKQFFTLGGAAAAAAHILGEWALSVPGEHTVRNAAAALALVSALLLSAGKQPALYEERLQAALLSFSGGRRRSEIIARTKTPLGEPLIVLDDYGHHPTAIKTTLSGYRTFYKNHTIIVDFMSHTYTRTQALLEEFASSFADADFVIINKIYASARENADDSSVTGELLAERTKAHNPACVYAETFEEAAQVVLTALSKPSGSSDGYLFVTMGAGDNWKVGKLVLEKL
mgnify:CR=1 FL=1